MAVAEVWMPHSLPVSLRCFWNSSQINNDNNNNNKGQMLLEFNDRKILILQTNLNKILFL